METHNYILSSQNEWYAGLDLIWVTLYFPFWDILEYYYIFALYSSCINLVILVSFPEDIDLVVYLFTTQNNEALASNWLEFQLV